MNKGFLIIAALIGAMSVALGAFAAHGLKEKIDSASLSVFETGIKYMFYHVFALLAAGILTQFISNKFIVWSGRLFIAGIVLFSGSLIALTFILANNIDTLRWIGAITPIGGLCFIAGWIFLATGIMKS